jgi:hypothetical protein
MARPQKEGIDYFPVNCQFNDSVKLIQAEFGLIGLGVLVRLWQKIYGGKGYYTPWDDDVALVFAAECGAGVNVVKEIVSACFRRGLFDRQMYDTYKILTSEGIQERYAEATDRRVSQKFDSRFLLIAIPQKEVNVDNNSINVDNNAVNDCKSTQSKVNKIKVNKTILNDIDTTTTNAHVTRPPTFAIVDYFEDSDVKNAAKQAERFIEFNERHGWACLPNWQAAADAWIMRI